MSILPRWLTAAAAAAAAGVFAQNSPVPDVLAASDAAESGASAEVVKNVKLSNLRLGFVNFRRIMATAPQLTIIRKTLDEEFKDQQSALAQSQRELNELERRVQQAQGEANYDALAQQLIAKRRETARQDAQFRDNYSVRRNEEIAKLQTLVLNQIIGVAKEQGFDVILNDTGVIYVSDKADLTDIVIERLSKLAPSADMPAAKGTTP